MDLETKAPVVWLDANVEGFVFKEICPGFICRLAF